MKLSITVIIFLTSLIASGQRHNSLIQDPQLYKRNGVKKIQFKFAYRNERIYNYVLDTNGNVIQHFVQTKENGPVEFDEYYILDSHNNPFKEITLLYNDTEKPATLRNIPDTAFTFIEYNQNQKPIRRNTFKKNKLSSSTVLLDNGTHRTISYPNKEDSIISEYTYDKYEHPVHVSTDYHVKNNNISKVVQMISYKYSKGQIKKEMKTSNIYTKNNLKNNKYFNVIFYTYFKNQLMKKIDSKFFYGAMFKYEYF